MAADRAPKMRSGAGMEPGHPIMKKLALLLALLAVASAFFAFDLDRLLTLEGIKASQQHFAAMLDDSWALVAAAFFLLYVLVTAVSLPGATVMTLAAGALFGLGGGMLIVSFARHRCNMLSLLLPAARYRAALGARLQSVNDLSARGAFCCSRRLVPLFPFSW
jgi:uncharacterized membrane protein YdjX (TVP38/TMEM64 family)